MTNRRSWRGNRGIFRGGNSRGRGGRGFMGNNGRGGWFGANRNQYIDNSVDAGRKSQQRQNSTMTKRLSEQEIGVTQYISDHEGFNGIIKTRYSDFQVSEINMNGEIAKLTSLEPPELPKEKEIDEDEELLMNKYNLEILPMETWDNINKLAVANTVCTEKVQVDVTGMTKEQRTLIHDAVKKAFGKIIVGSTVTVDDKKYVCFERFRKGVRIDNREKWLWPGEYTYFIVHKENCDTMEAAARIADRLRLNLKPSMLGYAGTKDRRAKTSQWFSLRKVAPGKIAAACKDMREIHVGNYTFQPNNLRLGMLKGNRFRIVLRNVTAADACVDAACALLQRRGFLNYYGLQRFGSRIDTPTYEIGLKLIQGKINEAINTILENRPGALQQTLEVFHAEGAAAAWRTCNKRLASTFPNELRLIRALASNPSDRMAAIGKIPRNARLLYVHSYQSLVWNKAASERIKLFGLKPAVGDLVLFPDVQIAGDIEDSDDSEDEDADDKIEPDSSKKEDAANDADKTDSTQKNMTVQEKGKEGKTIPVRVLTQEDIDSGQYTIFDVVLPLPGNSIQYPPNMIKFYEDLLAADGLTLAMKNRCKWFSMSGAYRQLAVRPSAVHWRSVRYADPRADLLLSDYDKLRGHTDTGIVEDGKYKALLLTLTLPTSCYATMALRELLKVDTSCDNQALQNNYHQLKNNKPGNSSGDQNGDAQTENLSENQNEDQNGTQNENENESENGGVKRKLDCDPSTDVKKTKSDD